MRRNLGLRIGLVVVVIAVSVWYLYPPRTSINLGLDLQGGIHLVLGVDVDKALEAQVERAGNTVRGELEKKGIAISKIERRGIADLAIQIARSAIPRRSILEIAMPFFSSSPRTVFPARSTCASSALSTSTPSTRWMPPWRSRPRLMLVRGG